MTNRTWWRDIVAVVLILVGILALGAESARPKPSPEPRIYVGVYDADWCVACKRWLANAKAAGLPCLVDQYDDLPPSKRRLIDKLPAVYLWVDDHCAARIRVEKWYPRKAPNG